MCYLARPSRHTLQLWSRLAHQILVIDTNSLVILSKLLEASSVSSVALRLNKRNSIRGESSRLPICFSTSAFNGLVKLQTPEEP